MWRIIVDYINWKVDYVKWGIVGLSVIYNVRR